MPPVPDWLDFTASLSLLLMMILIHRENKRNPKPHRDPWRSLLWVGIVFAMIIAWTVLSVTVTPGSATDNVIQGIKSLFPPGIRHGLKWMWSVAVMGYTIYFFCKKECIGKAKKLRTEK